MYGASFYSFHHIFTFHLLWLIKVVKAVELFLTKLCQVFDNTTPEGNPDPQLTFYCNAMQQAVVEGFANFEKCGFF